jgi:lactoylglutathione lyase
MSFSAQLSLVVIRSPQSDELARCYSALGLSFEKHRHGKGPEHYACEQDGMVFEIYPGEADNTRLGFRVVSVNEAIERWENVGGAVSLPPKASEWGLRAVLIDPDGRKIELIERSETARSAGYPAAG